MDDHLMAKLRDRLAQEGDVLVAIEDLVEFATAIERYVARG